MELRILSGGAAKGLVTNLRSRFTAETGASVEGTFSAVGAMKEKFLAGEPCDVLILTAALIDELIAQGHLAADSSAPLGRVRTGIAVPSGRPFPAIDNADALRECLRAATDGIYTSDPERSTAGIHFIKVLKQLGIHEELVGRLKPFANGALAMHAMGQTTQQHVIGCTQITEIKYTEGVDLVGPLPKEFELATVYSVAVRADTPHPDLARHLVTLLSGHESAALRTAGGFEF